jgi:large subunit ribosomal protein L22
MEVRATAKYVKVQPRKVRILADKLRGRPANYSSALLRYHPSKGAECLRKVLESAMANALENHQLSRDSLRISTIVVDEGPVQKRMRARAMGRGYRILKKTSHITVVVEDFEAPVKTKAKSKAKPRPTFGAPAKKGKGKKAAEPKAEASALEETPIVDAAEEPVVETAAEEPAVEPAAEPEAVSEAEAPAEEATETEAPKADAEKGAE